MDVILLIKAAAASTSLAAIGFFGFLNLNEISAVEAVSALAEPQLVAKAEAYAAMPSRAPDIKIRVAESLMATGGAHDGLAYRLLESALEADPERPFALALQSYALSRDAGTFDQNAEAALRQSIALCPLCDRDLLKWRLEYVLSQWTAVPDDLRVQVFEGADFLRWWHLDYDYLAQLRIRAEATDIPFALYQKRIDTPVRPNEIGRP